MEKFNPKKQSSFESHAGRNHRDGNCPKGGLHYWVYSNNRVTNTTITDTYQCNQCGDLKEETRNA
jgi:hypothetical protein